MKRTVNWNGNKRWNGKGAWFSLESMAINPWNQRLKLGPSLLRSIDEEAELETLAFV